MFKALTVAAILLMTALSLSAQISTTNVAPKNLADSTPYDSTKNFLGHNVHKYVGQELYVNPSDVLKAFGFSSFMLDYREDNLVNSKNIYACCHNNDGIYSKYEALAGKYLEVLEVIRHPEWQTEPVFANDYYLKLREKESGDVFYYEYSADFESSFPFTVVGYFVKLRKKMMGTSYTITGENWLGETLTDVNTGKPITSFTAGSVWKVVDVTMIEDYGGICYIIQNSKGEKLPLPIDQTKGTRWVSKTTK